MTVLEQRAYEAICDMARSKRGEPGYWDQLRHQAAIAAMQGFLAGRMEDTYLRVAEFSIKQADVLIEKLKEDRL